MKYVLQIIILLYSSSFAFSQRSDTVKRTYNDIHDLNNQTEEDQIKLFKHVD